MFSQVFNPLKTMKNIKLLKYDNFDFVMYFFHLTQWKEIRKHKT